VSIVAHTVRRDTLTWLLTLKSRCRLILRKVNTASASAHKQKLRMPVSRAGISRV
jgi:hypothetical protein